MSPEKRQKVINNLDINIINLKRQCKIQAYMIIVMRT